ncbi:MAG: adenylate/guanylate cyclase domain-containing protein [Polyangiaceae bacterium]
MPKMKTVRMKLFALVGISLTIILASIGVLRWLLHEQLFEEVNDRVEEAHKAFQEELDDDIDDATVAARVIATSSDTRAAMIAHDPVKAKALGQTFLNVYPDIDILFVAPDGSVITSLGCDNPPATIGALGDVKQVIEGKQFIGLIEHGCELSSAKSPPPAYVIAIPVEGAGAIVLCLPYSEAFMNNAGTKLDLELSLVSPDSKIINATKNYPRGAGLRKAPNLSVVKHDGRTWISGRFQPKQLMGPKGSYTIVAGMDVTDIDAVVTRNLNFALLIILFAAVISLITAWRIASTMSNAVSLVSDAHKKLALHSQYVQVTGVNTGDELEQLATGFNSMIIGLQERDRDKAMFGKYLTASVMDHVRAGRVQPGGELKPVTILFSDIRSFTTISENMDAKALVALLNEYFTEMVGIVMEENGVVDKYIGDAIMAVFGAPVGKDDDPIRAVRAAVRMRGALAKLNISLEKRGMQQLRTGIGVHTGVVVAGNLGSEKRMEYTVIGDAVNLASRLESATKELQVNILISEDTFELVKDAIVTKPVKEIHVKGRGKPVMTYEVLGIKGEPLLPKDEYQPGPTPQLSV